MAEELGGIAAELDELLAGCDRDLHCPIPRPARAAPRAHLLRRRGRVHP